MIRMTVRVNRDPRTLEVSMGFGRYLRHMPIENQMPRSAQAREIGKCLFLADKNPFHRFLTKAESGRWSPPAVLLASPSASSLS